MKLANRIQQVQPSPTLAISARASALQEEGVDIISFGAGEPDFNTPESVCDACKDALDTGHTGYTAAAGIAQLRQAIAHDYRERRGRDVQHQQVVVTTGGKFALYAACLSLFEPGDRVLVPAPYWVSYPAQITLAGAEPVTPLIGQDEDFKLSPQRLEQIIEEDAITGLVLCSPSNPTGAVYTTGELAALGQVIARHPQLVVFFDAMYDRLYYDGDLAPDLVTAAPQIADQVITFNGFSKTYAMTGWRMGYAIGPHDAIAAMIRLQSHSTSNPTTFAQYGALAALKLDDAIIDDMRDTFRARRDLIVAGLRDISGLRCATPQGAFYAFPDASHFIGPDGPFADDMALANHLLDEAQVAVVPGSAFGAPGHMRLSYATSEDLIEEGIARIARALG